MTESKRISKLRTTRQICRPVSRIHISDSYEIARSHKSKKFTEKARFLRYFHTMMNFRQTWHGEILFSIHSVLDPVFYMQLPSCLPFFRKTNNVVLGKLLIVLYYISLSYAIGKQLCSNEIFFPRESFETSIHKQALLMKNS